MTGRLASQGSASPARRSLPRMPKFLVLGPDPSQRWELPEDTDLGGLRDHLWLAIKQGEAVGATVVIEGQQAELLVNGSAVAAAAVVEVPAGAPRPRAPRLH